MEPSSPYTASDDVTNTADASTVDDTIVDQVQPTATADTVITSPGDSNGASPLTGYLARTSQLLDEVSNHISDGAGTDMISNGMLLNAVVNLTATRLSSGAVPPGNGVDVAVLDAIESRIQSLPSWTPVIRVVNSGSRSVLHILDWTGGKGTKPHTGYIGRSGLVSSISRAANVRGTAGARGATGPRGATGARGPQGASTQSNQTGRQITLLEAKLSAKINTEVARLTTIIRDNAKRVTQHYHDMNKYAGQQVIAGFAPGYLTGAARDRQERADWNAAWDARRREEEAQRQRGAGASVPADTPVLMADGDWKPIIDIGVGEHIQGRTRVNQVLAFDRVVLGSHRNPTLYSVNGDYANTDDHLTLLDRGWAVLDHDSYLVYHGQPLDCVFLGDGTPVQTVFDGITPANVSEYGVGDKIAFGATGFKDI